MALQCTFTRGPSQHGRTAIQQEGAHLQEDPVRQPLLQLPSNKAMFVIASINEDELLATSPEVPDTELSAVHVKSLWSPCGVLGGSTWVHVESLWSPSECMWSPCGVHVESSSVQVELPYVGWVHVESSWC